MRVRVTVRHTLAWLMIVVLSACQGAQYRTVNQDVLNDIQQSLETAGTPTAEPGANGEPPPAVLEALVPGLTLNSAALQPVEERFDFVVQQPMDAREFFTLLTEGTDYSIAIHPDVSGNISALDLKNVTIQEALDQVSALYGYSISRTGNIFQVMPGGMQTRIFKVNYLNVTRNGTSNMSVVTAGIMGGGQQQNNMNNLNGGNLGAGGIGGIGGIGAQGINGNTALNGQAGAAGGGNSGGASINTTSESDYWEDLEDILRSLINAEGPTDIGGTSLLGALSSNAGQRAVIVSPQTGMVVVRAMPAELEQVAEFLAESQDVLQRQVILEAKILEVQLNENFQSGIDLAALGSLNGNPVEGRFRFLQNLEGDSGLGDFGGDSVIPGANNGSLSNALASIGYRSSDFEGVIKLLEAQGNVQVISSPRISTLNNQKAVFKVGNEEYYSTNPTTNTVTADSSTTTNRNPNLQPFFSGIALDVTPQISNVGDIILHIHPLLNEVEEKITLIGTERLSLASSTTRESDSIARARNGEVIVISGLMQTRASGDEAGIPGAKNVPLVGDVLGQRQTRTEKIELVILLRAVVDEGSNMQDMLQEHTDSFDDLRLQLDPYYRQ